MNILFLDIDGVLNSKASFMAIGASMPSHIPKNVILNPVAVGLLKELCKECDFKIYIHSTWARKRCDEVWFQKVFALIDFFPIILDRIHNRENRNSRIKLAIEHYRPDDFIVLDDSQECEVFGEKFIHVDNRDGLSWENYAKVLELFDKDIPVILI